MTYFLLCTSTRVRDRGGSEDELHKLSADELVHFNPILKNYTPTTRLAYAKFKSFVAKDLKVGSDSKDKFGEETETSKRITPTISRLSSFVEKKTSSLQGSLNDSLSNLAIKEELEMEKSPEPFKVKFGHSEKATKFEKIFT